MDFQPHLFQVRASLNDPRTLFLCVTGDARALGGWNVEESLKLKKSEEEDNVWEFPLSLSHLEEVNYRYLVCSELNWRGEKKLIVEQFESTIHPRKFVSSSTAVKGSVPVVVDDGEFGTTRRGEHSVDEGWLDHVSELQLHLHSSTEPGVRLEGELKDEEIKIKFSVAEYGQNRDLMEFAPRVKVKRMKLATGDCVCLNAGDAVLVSDEENEILVFSTRRPDFSRCAILVDIFSGKDGEFLGRSSILPQHLKDDGGRLTLTISNKELLPVGVLQCDYIIVHPMGSPAIRNLSNIFSQHWDRTNGCVTIGHKGMGSSFDCTQTDCIIPTENTISSFREAANHGAEFVEFDVLLTSDLVPVVFHDFDICVELSESGDNHSVVYPVKVKDLTLSDLRHTKLYHEHALNGYGSAELERFSINEGSDRHHLERRSFPTLEEVFKEVPNGLGFNIEVKYPSPAVADRGFPYFSYNLLADVLIKAVYRLHDGKRRVFFSTFDTDLCTMLRLKQPRFPVFYLTCTEAHTWRYLDVRMQSLSAALAYTKLQNLPGICTYSNMVIDNPNLVRAIQDLGLIMLTFGDKNNKKKNIALQQETGVDGVICDIWKLH